MRYIYISQMAICIVTFNHKSRLAVPVRQGNLFDNGIIKTIKRKISRNRLNITLDRIECNNFCPLPTSQQSEVYPSYLKNRFTLPR